MSKWTEAFFSTAEPPGVTALNSALMPACSCSRQFPCAWKPSLSSSLVGPVVPILWVVLSQGHFALKPQPEQVPGDHSPQLSSRGTVPRVRPGPRV